MKLVSNLLLFMISLSLTSVPILAAADPIFLEEETLREIQASLGIPEDYHPGFEEPPTALFEALQKYVDSLKQDGTSLVLATEKEHIEDIVNLIQGLPASVQFGPEVIHESQQGQLLLEFVVRTGLSISPDAMRNLQESAESEQPR